MNVSKLSYVSKDYESIYNELKDIVPNISKLWNTDSESDPGNVLLKLISILGDMLSYNLDFQILELFPSTVSIRKNARQIFDLVGYRMHWYRSAICDLEIRNTNSQNGIIPIYTTFSDSQGSVTYTTLQQYSLPNDLNNTYTTIEVIQGIPVTPSKIYNNLISKYSTRWYDIYDFNVQLNNISSTNRIYFSYDDVDELHIRLIDEYGEEWSKVDNLNIQSNTNKVFEFNVDLEDNPYIELCSYWKDYNCSKFKLFYIRSSGLSGEISENVLTKVTSPIVSIDISDGDYLSTKDITNDIEIVGNTASSYGYNPEEPSEARESAYNYVNTNDTLITLDDYTKAVKRLDGVANCICTDSMTDPDNTDSNKIKIYIVRSPEYEYSDNDAFANAIETSINDKKILPVDVEIDLENINRYTWSLKGEIYLKSSVDTYRASQILYMIDSKIYGKYNINKSEFNETVNYLDIINEIMSVDPLIRYVNLEKINYYKDGEVFSDEEISGSYTQKIESYNFEDSGHYIVNIPNTPIKPGSINIRYNDLVIVDNKNGDLVSNNSSVFNTGTVNYTNGYLEFWIYNPEDNILGDLTLSYNKNVINIVEYSRWRDIDSFKISNESISY